MGARPRTLDMREVCNASFYRLRNGCQWRSGANKPDATANRMLAGWIYEYLPTRSETMLDAAMVHPMLRRLAPAGSKVV